MVEHNHEDNTDPAEIWDELDEGTRGMVAKLFMHVAYCFLIAGGSSRKTIEKAQGPPVGTLGRTKDETN